MGKIIKAFRFGKVINMFRWLKDHRPRLRKREKPKKLNNLQEVVNHYGAANPWALGKMFYKTTECGVWTSFVLKIPTMKNGVKRVDLYYETHPLEIMAQLDNISGITFGSIVEGSDQCADQVSVMFPCTPEDIDAALKEVEAQVTEIWNATHGCPGCYHGGDAKAWAVADERPVNPDCPECSGDGIIL